MYRHYVKDVYHYALALLRNPADAEDVTQTTFLNAYRAYQRGIEIEKPHNWLIKIAHNVARTRYAHASRRVKEVPLDDHVEQLALPEADRPDVTGVLRALGRLPFNQRAALVMRELEGRSYAEIADTMAVSVSAVETLIFRARKSLRLKASSVRSLAAVPLPTSLTQFFGGGGVIAGGGAGVGTGVLLKAAVAIVAAAFGTSVGGDNTRPATASPSPTTGSAAARASAGGVQGPNAEQAGRLGIRSGADAATKSSPGKTATGLAAGLAAVDPVTGQLPAGQGASPSSDTGPTAKSHSGLVSQVTTAAADLAGSAQQVVASPASALPVQVPSLPAVPTLPPLPSLPALPAPPTAAIAVPKVQLPPPPSLPPPPPLPLP
jgi:RNA polymerase sigma factor (sigma-70 family)